MDLQQALKQLGYTDLKQDTKKRILVYTDNDRDYVYADIAKQLGGKHDSKPRSGFSKGVIEFNDGQQIAVKPKTGGGSGAGAKMTGYVESMQCYWLAMKQENAKSVTEPSVAQYVDVSEQVQVLLKEIPENWFDTFEKTANVLLKKFNNKKYTFHRDSSWVNELNNLFKRVNKPRRFSNINKWNPADIWMISQEGKTIPLHTAKNLVELNAMMSEAYASGDIIGVSLKKVGSTAKLSEVNKDNKRSQYVLTEWSSGKSGPLKSKDCYIFYRSTNDTGKIQFRTFGQSWQGEIKGKTANHGKIGGGNILGILKDMGFNNILSQRNLNPRNHTELFWKWYDIVERNASRKYFDEMLAKEDMNFWVSNAMNYQLLSAVVQMSPSKRNQFVSMCINYAASQDELSSPFVKIS